MTTQATRPGPFRHPLSTPIVAAVAAVIALVLPASAAAQPFGGWNIFDRPQQGYLEIPHSPALNPGAQITIEGWVAVQDGGGCSSIIGKGFQSAWWVGICGDKLRSYLRGGTSVRTAGVLSGGWDHFAVTFDGTRRRHYVNGELVGAWIEPGALTTNALPVRIGSDVDLAGFSPDGSINRIRLWNVARTTQQIRDALNEPITAPQPHLVAVWGLAGSDLVGSHDGSVVGTVPALTFPVTAFPCSNTATSLCLHDHFVVSVRWRTGTNSGPGTLAPLTTVQSGIFWFFNPTNWEVMVKVLNGCPLNDRWWVFTAATTNVFYRLEVLDIENGVNKVYFNYQGPPAPAITDTAALATCP